MGRISSAINMPPIVTQTEPGLMNFSDKKKLDDTPTMEEIKITIDSAINEAVLASWEASY